MRSYEPGAPETIKMGSHLTKHGDGVKDVAFRYIGTGCPNTIHAVLPPIFFAAAIGKLTHSCRGKNRKSGKPFFGLFQGIKCTYLSSFSS